jgi:hypothetical protein
MMPLVITFGNFLESLLLDTICFVLKQSTFSDSLYLESVKLCAEFYLYLYFIHWHFPPGVGEHEVSKFLKENIEKQNLKNHFCNLEQGKDVKYIIPNLKSIKE